MDELERQLITAIRQADGAAKDDDFAERVMAQLPRRRFAGARARRWTLALAAASGALFTALFGAPLDRAIDLIAPGADDGTWLVAMFAALLLAVPAMWSLWNARD